MTDVRSIIKKYLNYVKEANHKKNIKTFKEHIMMIYIPMFLCFFKWLIFAMAIGAIVGGIGTLFHYSILYATKFRTSHTFVIWLLPLGGLMVTGFYYLMGIPKDTGTNKILSAVRESTRLNPRRLVCVFVSSVITHFFGGSSGREGAAIQIGGSVGSFLGRKMHLDSDDHRIMVMCGMSAGFAALFGTPVAAAVFAIEVISVGILHYSAIVPCMISAVMGYSVASYFGVTYMQFNAEFPSLTLGVLWKLVVFSALCGILSWICCFIFKGTADTLQKIFKNQFLRIAVGGAIVAVLTFLVGNYDYNGIGTDIIYRSFATKAMWYVFILKLIFTAITLGSGFKGGEIVPVFFIGAAYGSFFSGIFGTETSFFAAVGMVAVFCGVTNCPLTSMLIGVESFGSKGLVFFGISCAVSYMLSGYRGLYSEQRIAYSKLKTKFINKKVGSE